MLDELIAKHINVHLRLTPQPGLELCDSFQFQSPAKNHVSPVLGRCTCPTSGKQHYEKEESKASDPILQVTA